MAETSNRGTNHDGPLANWKNVNSPGHGHLSFVRTNFAIDWPWWREKIAVLFGFGKHQSRSSRLRWSILEGYEMSVISTAYGPGC
ncbi:hypothetical protein, partial [Pseudarthrobacter sp. fls2-241-R2A-168]|uniref:hypothetical protein n=1 Tax=Pseudarthrobacter sp. fls2-241-R2A-168 TaxID=3040304 RepID=UPI0025550324